jgi:hypothetical protein
MANIACCQLLSGCVLVQEGCQHALHAAWKCSYSPHGVTPPAMQLNCSCFYIYSFASLVSQCDWYFSVVVRWHLTFVLHAPAPPSVPPVCQQAFHPGGI